MFLTGFLRVIRYSWFFYMPVFYVNLIVTVGCDLTLFQGTDEGFMKKTVLIPVKSSVLHKPHGCLMQAENMDLLTDDIRVRQVSLLLLLSIIITIVSYLNNP